MATTPRRFSTALVELFRSSKIIGIRVGSSGHRFIGLWVVVVDERVFVRSWSITPGGWYDTVRRERSGRVQVGDRQLRFRAVLTRSQRLIDEVSLAFGRKYATPGAQKYVRDFRRPKSRAATVEITPG